MADVKLQKVKRPKPLVQRIKENKKYQRISVVLWPLLFGILIYLLWQTEVLHTIFHTDTFTLPLPSKISSIIGSNVGDILVNTGSTVTVAGIGLVVGCLIGYGVAVLASMFPKLGTGGLAIIGAFASVPVVAMAPVLNNLTKDISKDASIRSMVAKIIVVVLISAANMSLNAYRGLTELKPFSKDLMKIYAAKRFVVLTKLRIPNSVPYIFTSLKVAVPASIMTAIVSEYFAEYIMGVGRQIRENIVLAQYATAWAYIAIACVIGIVSYIILMIAQSILLKRYR